MHPITTKVLLDTFTRIGMPLHPAETGSGNLYIWTSRQAGIDGSPVYIGQSTDTAKKRVANEIRWAKDFDRRSLLDTHRSVIATTVVVHDARPVELRWDMNDLDEAKVLDALDETGLTGKPVENLKGLIDGTWSPYVSGMEQILIRAVVHTGTLIANSDMAGQWESQVGNPMDTLGRLAAVASGHLDGMFPPSPGE